MIRVVQRMNQAGTGVDVRIALRRSLDGEHCERNKRVTRDLHLIASRCSLRVGMGNEAVVSLFRDQLVFKMASRLSG